MSRRDFTAGLLLAAAVRTVRAQRQATQHRIAIVIPAGTVTSISETFSCQPWAPILHGLWGYWNRALRKIVYADGINVLEEPQ